MDWATPAITRPALLPVLEELARLQACGRCCLRLAGERLPPAYLAVPGTARVLVEALHAAAGLSADSTGGRKRKFDEDDQACQPQAVDLTAADEAVEAKHGSCPLCLGILQCLSDSASTVAGAEYCRCELVTTSTSLDLSAEAAGPTRVGTSCRPIGCLQQAAEAVAAEYEMGPFALEVCLPAAAAVRAQALHWHLLQLLSPEQAAAAGLLSQDRDRGPVGLKEAVRLVYGHQLERLLHQPQDQQSGLRLSLAFGSSSTATEADWLASSEQLRQQKRAAKGQGGRHQAGQGGDSQQELSAAEAAGLGPLSLAASDALVARLAGMQQGAFLAACPRSAAQLQLPAGPALVQVQAQRRPLHVAGRYLKLKRGIPQSPWFIDGQRKGESSVQEEIARAVLPHFCADSYTFLSAGREDWDVRMLGSGRPFILEIQNARRGLPSAEECSAMQAAVNQANCGVAVEELRPVDAQMVGRLKEGEQEKQKSYTALCWLPRRLTDADVAAVEAAGEVQLQQQTPVRVLHRRANMVRSRAVHSMRLERLPAGAGQQESGHRQEEHGAVQQQSWPAQQAGAQGIQQHEAEQQVQQQLQAAPAQGLVQQAGAKQQAGGEYFLLHLRTQAGTYVKEFVHGDLGRTRPSLGQLLGGCQAEIVWLDVTEVHMDLL